MPAQPEAKRLNGLLDLGREHLADQLIIVSA
jgi:hypothetical protein